VCCVIGAAVFLFFVHTLVVAPAAIWVSGALATARELCAVIHTCMSTNLDPVFPFGVRELQEAEAPVWLSRSQIYAVVHSRGFGELYRKAEAVIGQGTEHKSVGSTFRPLPVADDPAPSSRAPANI